MRVLRLLINHQLIFWHLSFIYVKVNFFSYHNFWENLLWLLTIYIVCIVPRNASHYGIYYLCEAQFMTTFNLEYFQKQDIQNLFIYYAVQVNHSTKLFYFFNSSTVKVYKKSSATCKNVKLVPGMRLNDIKYQRSLLFMYFRPWLI